MSTLSTRSPSRRSTICECGQHTCTRDINNHKHVPDDRRSVCTRATAAARLATCCWCRASAAPPAKSTRRTVQQSAITHTHARAHSHMHANLIIARTDRIEQRDRVAQQQLSRVVGVRDVADLACSQSRLQCTRESSQSHHPTSVYTHLHSELVQSHSDAASRAGVCRAQQHAVEPGACRWRREQRGHLHARA
jgi:hypothetical protein